MPEAIKKHKIKSGIAAVILVYIVWAISSGTISYPYILVTRQYQIIHECTYSHQEQLSAYGYKISVPPGICLLPNFYYPQDATVKAVPRAFYTSWGEYVNGTLADASQAIFKFEPIVPERNPQSILNTLRAGEFIDSGSQVSEKTLPSGIHLYFAKKTHNLDNSEYVDWVFITAPNNPTFINMYVTEDRDPKIFNYILDNIEVDPGTASSTLAK